MVSLTAIHLEIIKTDQYHKQSFSDDFRTWLGQRFAGDDLQQEHQLQAISEIFLDVLDLSSSLSEMGVDPGSEGLQELFGTIKQNSKSTFCQ